jgi:hypothetical protein
LVNPNTWLDTHVMLYDGEEMAQFGEVRNGAPVSLMWDGVERIQ